MQPPLFIGSSFKLKVTIWLSSNCFSLVAIKSSTILSEDAPSSLSLQTSANINLHKLSHRLNLLGNTCNPNPDITFVLILSLHFPQCVFTAVFRYILHYLRSFCDFERLKLFVCDLSMRFKPLLFHMVSPTVY